MHANRHHTQARTCRSCAAHSRHFREDGNSRLSQRERSLRSVQPCALMALDKEAPPWKDHILRTLDTKPAQAGMLMYTHPIRLPG